MAEYIERDKIFSVWRSMPAPASVISLSAAIHQTPAIDIVHCKDCDHWGGKYATNECSLITQLGNPDYWLKTAPDDFCSSGKRKEK